MSVTKAFIVASALVGVLSTVPGEALARASDAQAAKDSRELKDYQLTMPVIDKIAKANKTAKQAMAKDPKQQRLATLEAELAALTVREDLTEAEWKRMGVLEDEISRWDDDDADDDLNGAGTISEFTRRVEVNPALAAAIRSVGLTPREYATALLALLQATLTDGLIEQKLLKQAPPEVSRHNLDFVRQHRAQLTATGVLSPDDD